jgi:hypothetical protein
LKHQLQGALHRSPAHSFASASEHLAFSDQFNVRPARGIGTSAFASTLRARASASSSYIRSRGTARSASNWARPGVTSINN